MTGHWLTLNAAASRITTQTGLPVSMEDVRRLGREQGPLTVTCLYEDHLVVLEESLTAYLSASELATPSGEVLAEHVDKPSWTPWSAADDPEARDEQADYDDTPNDEGDDN